MASWEVTLVRKRGERLGVVEAKDEAAATDKAAELFSIPPDQRHRVIVAKLATKDD